MSERFCNEPILRSPYERPSRHRELVNGIPMQKGLEGRREWRLITPIPRPRKHGGKGEQAQQGSCRDADGTLRSAGILIGPEFGTVTRVDLVEAGGECADAGFDVLISCAFNYEAQSTEFNKLGPIPVLKARMNADLPMQPNLANSGKGNLFVIFGERDIDILAATGLDGQPDQIQAKINSVDAFGPSTGEVRSDEPDNIACWYIDSDYNGESFLARQTCFLDRNGPYGSLRTPLKAEIDLEAWESLNSDISIAFTKPSTGCIAVKAINHLGDEVMKVYRV